MSTDKPVNNDTDIIKLTQVVESRQEPVKDPRVPGEPISTGDLTRFDETDNDLGKLVRDVVEDLPSDAIPPGKGTGSVQVSMEKIEAALERVVAKLYSKKIEELVMDTIEKTVQTEIKKIKNIMKEMAENGPE